MPEILHMMPDREQWPKLTTVRIAGLILSKSDQETSVMVKAPDMLTEGTIPNGGVSFSARPGAQDHQYPERSRQTWTGRRI